MHTRNNTVISNPESGSAANSGDSGGASRSWGLDAALLPLCALLRLGLFLGIGSVGGRCPAAG